MNQTPARLLALITSLAAPSVSAVEEIAQAMPLERLDVARFIDAFRVSANFNVGLELDNFPTELDFERYTLRAFLSEPIALGGDWSFITYLNYSATRLDFSSEPLAAVPGSPELSDTYHSVGLPFALIHSGSRWSYGAWVHPAIASDFETINSDDFFLDAGLGVAYRVNECLYLGAGIYGSDLTNDPFIIGGPGFFWLPNENWLVAYYGPRFVARRAFGDRTHIGFEVTTNGNQWNAETANDSYKVELGSWRAGLFVRRNIHKEMWLEAGLGYSFANSIDFRTPDGLGLYEDRTGDLDSAPYAYVGLSVARW